MIKNNRCNSCNNVAVGVTDLNNTCSMTRHTCSRCDVRRFQEVAEQQKEMWLAGADLNVINNIR